MRIIEAKFIHFFWYYTKPVASVCFKNTNAAAEKSCFPEKSHFFMFNT